MSISTAGLRVKERRKALGLTQHELAIRAKTTAPTIARLETGRIASPRNDLLRALAETLGTTTDYLTGAGDEPFALSAPTAPARESTTEYDSTVATGATISTYGAQPWYPRIEQDAREIRPNLPEWAWRDVRETHPARSNKVAVTPRVIADLAQYYYQTFPPPPDAEELERRRGK